MVKRSASSLFFSRHAVLISARSAATVSTTSCRSSRVASARANALGFPRASRRARTVPAATNRRRESAPESAARLARATKCRFFASHSAHASRSSSSSRLEVVASVASSSSEELVAVVASPSRSSSSLSRACDNSAPSGSTNAFSATIASAPSATRGASRGWARATSRGTDVLRASAAKSPSRKSIGGTTHARPPTAPHAEAHPEARERMRQFRCSFATPVARKGWARQEPGHEQSIIFNIDRSGDLGATCEKVFRSVCPVALVRP